MEKNKVYNFLTDKKNQFKSNIDKIPEYKRYNQEHRFDTIKDSGDDWIELKNRK